jgi:transcriptional regulator GlxA family with amidase domain
VKPDGRTPGYGLLTVYINAAKCLLAGSSEKIEMIAHRCGCPNPNCFFAGFRRYENVTPTEHRRNMSFCSEAFHHHHRTDARVIKSAS